VIIEIDDRLARRLGGLLRKELRDIGRNGLEPPEELIRLATQLDHVGVHYVSPRARSLNAERVRRWRLRQKGEDIPLRKPGPQPRARAS
jgi:hypothetical protein